LNGSFTVPHRAPYELLVYQTSKFMRYGTSSHIRASVRLRIVKNRIKKSTGELFYCKFLHSLHSRNHFFYKFKSSCTPVSPWPLTGDGTSQKTWYFHRNHCQTRRSLVFWGVSPAVCGGG